MASQPLTSPEKNSITGVGLEAGPLFKFHVRLPVLGGSRQVLKMTSLGRVI